MKIIALEEHLVTSEVLTAWEKLPASDRDLAYLPSTQGDTARRLLETSALRREAMAQTGVDVQVLSLTTPGLQNLPTGQAVRLQRETNNHIAEIVNGDPDHFQGLAALATGAPDEAAAELERAICEVGLDGAMLYGRTGTMSLDDPALEPLWATAELLQVPLHLHPQSPPPAVREAYYAGFDDPVSAGLATHGIGWHYDSGVQFLRMVLAGVFDRHPHLQLVVGHWGELVLFYTERIEHLVAMAGLQKTLAEYVHGNLYVTPSGMLSSRYLHWAIEVIGADRILFATDYPFEQSSQTGGRTFLESAPITDADRESIASGNWERLRAGIRR